MTDMGIWFKIFVIFFGSGGIGLLAFSTYNILYVIIKVVKPKTGED